MRCSQGTLRRVLSAWVHNAREFHRVAVTGLGLVTPLGVGVEENWSRLIKGQTAVRALKEKDLPESDRRFLETLNSRVVATVPQKSLLDCVWRPKQDNRNVLPFVDYAETAAAEALKDAGLIDCGMVDVSRIGVSIGVGMSGTHETASTWQLMVGSMALVLPTWRGSLLGQSEKLVHSSLRRSYQTWRLETSVSVYRYGFQGPNISLSTACAAGAHAIGNAFSLIREGQADMMVAGGSESCIDAIAFAGFDRMRALSTKHNANPEEASRPFDADRDGFVLGEGAGVAILENLEQARRRNVPIYAEICGYGMSGDGHHVTHPHPSGLGAILAMKAAIRQAELPLSAIQYINAHATSTPVGDGIELEAIRSLFGQAVNEEATTFVSSTKGATGHLLGAAGAVEAVYTILSVCNKRAPQTMNLSDPYPPMINTHVTQGSRLFEEQHLAALSNAFGFGGTNASLLFRSYVER